MPDSVPEFESCQFSSKENDYCVLIFVINEGDKLLKQLDRMAEAPLGVDVVVVDGGSSDGSTHHDELTRRNVNTLLVKTGAGKLGSQMRIGFSWALEHGYKGVVVIDGNNKDSVNDIPNFVVKLQEGYHHVQGSRFIPGGKAINTPKSRLLGLKLLHVPVMRAASGFKYTDTTNGFRAYSRELLQDKELSIFRDVFTGYEVHYYLACQAPRLGYRCTEIPVTRQYPATGKTPTKISPIRGNLQVIERLFNVALGLYDNKASGGGRRINRVAMIASLLIAFIAFFSYQFNAFHVTSAQRFTSFQSDSEQLIIDGISRAQVYQEPLKLGKYESNSSGTKLGELAAAPHLVDHRDQDIEETFVPYDSQYGLQLRVNYWFTQLLGDDFAILRGTSSMMMSLTVGAFCIFIFREFGFYSGIGFGIAMVLSPLVVLFANNLYWATWTWFMPALLSFYCARQLLLGGRGAMVATCFISVAFLIKFLCGYEYITTIGISSCVPLIYGFHRYQATLPQLIKSVSLLITAFVISLVGAFFIHAQSLEDGGFHALWKVVNKRVAVSSPEEQAKEFCLGSEDPDQCEADFLRDYGESLSANPFKVTAQYLVFPDLLPWVGMSNYPLTQEDRTGLKKTLKEARFSEIGSFFSQLKGRAVLTLLLIALNAVGFLSFCVMICKKVLGRRKQYPREGLYLLALFIAPLSWFFLAKGHSQIHEHLNYVLWFVLFVPLGTAYLFESDQVPLFPLRLAKTLEQ